MSATCRDRSVSFRKRSRKSAHGAGFNMSTTLKATAEIVSKKLNAPYRSGPSRTWIKVKNHKAPAATRVIDGTCEGRHAVGPLMTYSGRLQAMRATVHLPLSPSIHTDGLTKLPGGRLPR